MFRSIILVRIAITCCGEGEIWKEGEGGSDGEDVPVPVYLEHKQMMAAEDQTVSTYKLLIK